ncbi:hydroxyisourate hydrolase [Pectobacterium betavasculorum]|uniref:5-hydroxyisourate hydrolase n=1 Tax=Pectobacterium betavasculorum TaxID=55207 RepID=A0ABR4UZV8_9GAMM|nr:hydroxyisourate hydrolase [Pectobacterium betavasculorum]KFX20376.1 5-hydroxyisourate hydrolase [Pectobacterium betavasculorum]
MSTLSTHILDIAFGHPAIGVKVRLERHDAACWCTIAEDVTNGDGRIAAFVNEPLPAGHYRLTAAIGDWFAEAKRESLFVEAQIDFRLSASGGHYHLPFLISPWSWSTYRGS